MNYGLEGIKKQQEKLNSVEPKLKKAISLILSKAIIFGTLAFIVLGCCLGIGAFAGVIKAAPEINALQLKPSGYATIVYDNQGAEISKLVTSNSNRTYVTFDKIPDHLSNAFVAIEDERFYSHNGIDIKGIIRAAKSVLTTRRLTQGASTITQQLLKNTVFDNWVDETDAEKIVRKIQEQYLALKISKELSKEDILESYLNTINLGHNTLGVQAAAKRYFDKDVWQLTLSESSVIASITKNPSKYDPILHPDHNKDRREEVLRKMLEQEMITKVDYDDAMSDPVYERIQDVNTSVSNNAVYSYYVDDLFEVLKQDLMSTYNYNENQALNLIYSGGLSVYSCMDSRIQSICDEAYTNEENFPSKTQWYLNYQLTIEHEDGSLTNYSTEMYKRYYKQFNEDFNLLYNSKEEAEAAIEAYANHYLGEGDRILAETISLTPQPQSSVTVMEQGTGKVVAMVGGRGPKVASRTLNRATHAYRQPGSTFKILSTFAPAVDTNLKTLADVQVDQPYFYDSGQPVRNWWGSVYRGIRSYRYGIEQSCNIIAVKTLTEISPRLGYEYLLKFGFTTLVEKDGLFSDIGQSLALGSLTKGVSNLELTAAYAAIGNDGVYVEPILYTRVYDHDGNVILDHDEVESHRVLEESSAWLITDAMQGVVKKGTGTKCDFDKKQAIAGKTGTTTDYKDVWFAGYTPYYACTVWTGYDNNTSMDGNDEAKNLSKTMWSRVMGAINEGLPYETFEMPAGITTCKVCSKSGKLPIPGMCDDCIVTEYFKEGTQPTEYCDSHYMGYICAFTGEEATDECPFKIPALMEKHPEPDCLKRGLLAALLYDEDGNRVDYEGNILVLDEAQIAKDNYLQAEFALGVDTSKCPHNAMFYSLENYEEILAYQQSYVSQGLPFTTFP